MREVEIGKIYRHFKSYDKLYEVEGIALDSVKL